MDIETLLKELDLELDKLYKEKRIFIAKAKKFHDKHAKLVPITEGPDRGYNKIVWDDHINHDVYCGLDDYIRDITHKMITLRDTRKGIFKHTQIALGLLNK